MTKNANIRRSRFSPSTALFLAFSAVTALACSGQDGTDVSEDFESADVAAETTLTSDEREAEFQRQLATPLSAEEMIAVESLLNERGVNTTKIGFAGRMVTLDGAYLEVDSLLGSSDAEGLAEKGRTLSVINTNTSTDGLQISPTKYSQIFNGVYQFKRPDISNSVTVVVPNGAAAAFLIPAFQTSVAAIWNAATDCLITVNVRTQAQYDALSANDKILTKPIFVRYGSQGQSCPGFVGITSCGLFPRNETRDFDINFRQTRLVPGTRIGILSSAFTTNNSTTRAALQRALLTTLGITSPAAANTVAVVGTSASTTVSSIFQAGATVLSTDDVDTIDTLFSPLPGAGCGWTDGLKNIPAN